MFSTCTAPHIENSERGWSFLNGAGRKSEQFVEDYGFTKDDLKRFMMIIEESTFDFYAGTSIPYERKMGIAT